MGADYSGHVIVGLRVTKEQLMPTTNIRGCHHIYDFAYPFCPYCRAATYISMGASIDAYDPDSERLAGYQVIDPGESDYLFISVKHVKVDEYDRYQKFESLAMARARQFDALKEEMNRLGLWNESEYGYWLVMGVSI